MNFFFEQEPHFAVGSVVKAEGSGYRWRCYADPFEGVGTEKDMKSAEERVKELCRKAAAYTPECAAAEAA
jgi:hypothetical protein